MNIGQKIIELRSRKGWTQQQLANCLHVSIKAVSDWELKGAIPRRAKLIRLANLFSVSVEQLTDDAIILSPPAEALSKMGCAAELRAKAATLRQIAEELEISADALEGRK